MVPPTFHASGHEMQSFTFAVLALCGVKNLQTAQSFLKAKCTLDKIMTYLVNVLTKIFLGKMRIILSVTVV